MSMRTCDDCAYFSRKDGTCVKRLSNLNPNTKRNPFDPICDDFYLDPFIEDMEVTAGQAVINPQGE